MSDLRELYQEVIIDHSKHPRHYGVLASANHTKEGFNPLCGDRLTIYVQETAGKVEQVQFVGSGCAISTASASLLTEVLTGKTLAEVDTIFTDFHHLVLHGHDPVIEARVGKLAVLAGVAEYPARVKCATLAWHTVKAALANDAESVSTE